MANYSVTRTTGIAYSSIMATGVPPSSWRNTGAFEEDDNRSFPFDIGFDFWYHGVRYTEVCVSTNGYIDFSASNNNGGPTTGPYGYSNTQFSAPGGTLTAIAPFYDDMTTQGGTDPLGNSIRYQLSGTAPNRVLTIEWFDMAVYLNTSPSLNFQVKLYETSGQIEFLYETMTQGTANFSYTCGLAGPVMNTTPTAAQLKIQQVNNTTTFNQTETHNLGPLPASNSRIRFTSPAPLNPAGTLTFTGVQASQMTLNWTNWAANEVGYVIYNSTDGVNWDFITQTAANATSATITGLYSGTTYYWRVYAVTEGTLSNALTGTQGTLPGTTYISTGSGFWNTAGTWNIGAVPGPNDNVIIANGHTVTINVNTPSCHNLSIGQGGAATLRFGNNNTARTLTVWGNIDIGAGCALTVNTVSNTTHTLNLYGDLTNNGTVDLQPDGNSRCNISFVHPYADQLVSGTGATNRFYNINVDKGDDIKRILEFTTSSFVAPNDFLTLGSGTFRLSTTGAVSITPFVGNSDIPSHARLHINSATATVNATGGNINLFGELLVSNGTLNIGSVANNNLVSNGGLFTLTGGNVNIAGRFDRVNTAALTRFSISGGTLTLVTVSSTSTTNAPFMMDVIGSQFTQTGGTIIIRREGGTGAQNLGFLCTGGVINSVTGGVLQIGDASTPVGQTMVINTVSPVGSLRVASANATAQLATQAILVRNDVELQAGIFNANNLGVTVGGNWNNTGGTYTAGTNTTTFNGTVAQTITRTLTAETFNHIVFSGAGVKTLGSAIGCNNVTINAGATFNAGTPGFTISTRGNWNNGGVFQAGTAGTVTCNGTVAQTIGGASLTTFRNLTILNAAGVSLTANERIRGTLTLTSGMFTTTGFNFTLVSDVNGTARVAEITGGDITGDIIMQRYIYLGPTSWRQLCAPVTGTTLQDWNDDLVTSGFPGSDFPAMTFYSVALYDETAAGPKEFGYSAPTNVTNALTPNRGYFVYVGPTPVTVATQGPAVKQNQSFALTYTPSAGAIEDGWNMLGNPYPSTIDWDAAGWTRTNIDNVVYVWNPNLSQYASYVGGVGVNGGTQYIPSSQAFWVRAIAPGPSVSLTEAVKSTVDQSFMHMQQQQQVGDLLSLTLSGANGADQTIVRFSPAGTAGFDVNYDAMKFGSMDTLVPYLASLIDSITDFSINTLSPVTTNMTVPLHAGVGVSGNFTFTRDSITDLPNSMCVILEDLLTGTVTQLSQGGTYSCYISDTTSALRFLLHFGPSLETGNIASTCAGNADGIAFAQGTGNGPWDYTWKDISGATIASHPNVTGMDTVFGLLPGDYIVEVSGNDGYCTFRSDTITVGAPEPVSTGATFVPATCSYTNDGAIYINIITGGTAPYALSWPDGSTADSLMDLTPGSYPLLITDGNGCVDTVQFILPTSSTLSASFTATPDTVELQALVTFANYSNGATNFTWDFGDGSPFSSASNPVYSYLTSGTYDVVLVADDGICSDTMTVPVFVFNNTSVQDHSADGLVQVVTGDQLIGVLFRLPSVQHARVQVFDAAGQLVADEDRYVGQGRLDIPMTGAAAQLYTVIVTLPEKIYSAKVIFIH